MVANFLSFGAKAKGLATSQIPGYSVLPNAHKRTMGDLQMHWPHGTISISAALRITTFELTVLNACKKQTILCGNES